MIALLLVSILLQKQPKILQDTKILIDGLKTRRVIVSTEYTSADTLFLPRDEVISYYRFINKTKVKVAVKSNMSLQFNMKYAKITEK